MRPSRAAVLSLLVPALLACEGRRKAAPAGGADSDEPRRGPAVAVLDLSEGVPEEASSGLLGLSAKGTTFYDVVHEVEQLPRDKDVKGVLVRLGTTRVGLARAEEIGALLGALGAKMPVWCHADDLSNATLYLAARSCTKVWLSPAASVDAIGLAAQSVYFHQLLAGTLGLDVDFLQVGKYKGAEEPFTRDGPSPEARESLQSTLSDMRTTWLGGIQAGRPSVAPDVPEDGPYAAPDAKERGLVDAVGYFDDARDALEKESGAVRAQVRLGAGAAAGGGDDLTDILRALAGESLGSAPIALVRANSAISMNGGGGLLAEAGGIIERRLVRTLTRLEKDDDVKAVVLRIDSPGGSALASDLLWHALMKIRAKKPLVVSVGGMAASGGYYLASAGSVVYAEDASIVGSIGVVGGKVSGDRALARLGVHAETLAAKAGDPKAAARASYESLFMPWDDATRERVLRTMTSVYDLFLARVAEGRNVPVEKVAASAEGRLFSGRDGKARGLVDELGGLSDALARARTLASLPADARVAVAGENGGLLDALAEDELKGQAPGAIAPSIAAPTLADLVRAELPAEIVPFVAAVAPLAGREHVLCALPFALSVQ